MDYVRPAKDSSKQCQQMIPTGQCPNEIVSDGKFCPVHDSLSKYYREQKNIHSLRLAQWQSRIDDHAEDANVKSLRGEIGVLRILLENTMVRCQDESELVLYSGKISDLVLKLEKLVVSCHKLEQGSAGTMDKAALLQFASRVVTIIGNHVTDVKLLDSISSDILGELANEKSI